MGVEAFGVSMRLIETDVYERATRAVTTDDRIRVLSTQKVPGFKTITAEYCDGIHIIEFQVMHVVASNHCNVAMRFSLCSFESIDSIFIELVRNFLMSFEAEIWLMTSAIKIKNHYLPGDSKWLIAALPDEIAEMRSYWQNIFGNAQGTVRVKDSFSFVGALTKQCGNLLQRKGVGS